MLYTFILHNNFAVTIEILTTTLQIYINSVLVPLKEKMYFKNMVPTVIEQLGFAYKIWWFWQEDTRYTSIEFDPRMLNSIT